MAKRIEIYPPSGGMPIKINEQDLASFEAKGWTDSPRSSKPKATKKVAKIETLESED